MFNSQKVSILLTLAITCGLCACGMEAEERSEERAAAITFKEPTFKPPITLKPRDLTDRLVWDDPNTNQADYWILRETGVRYSSTTHSGPHSWAVGVAGNKVLWASFSSATMHTVDDDGKAVSSHPIQTPPGGHYEPTGIALAAPTNHNCYRKSGQNYYVTWDGDDDFVVQLVSETGFVRRTVYTAKPFAGAQALWFGYGADGYEWVLFRDLSGNAWRYRAQYRDTPAPPHYELYNLRYTQRPAGMQVLSMTAKRRPKLFLLRDATTYNDHLLFGHWNGGSAKLLAFNHSGAPVRDFFGNHLVWNFASAGRYATAYAYVPPICQW